MLTALEKRTTLVLNADFRPPDCLHTSWQDYLYWDIKLDQ
jgi:hypothetical protein